MNGRTIAHVVTAVTSLGIGAVLTLSGTAAAEPAPPTPLEKGLTKLAEDAGLDPGKQAGVAALNQYTKLVDIAALQNIGSAFAPFAYAAPTFGCGSNGPITTTIAAVTTTGPNLDEGSAPVPGTLRFSAAPSTPGLPISSGLVVGWVNLSTGASGIDPLDDVTQYNLPSLSKTVNSGPGTVLASMWGTINYPGTLCVMTPTVGTFFVPDLPVEVVPAPSAPPIDPDTKKPLVLPGPDVHIPGTPTPSAAPAQPAPAAAQPEPQAAQPAPAAAPSPSKAPSAPPASLVGQAGN
ncbi:hypothetical protein [Nocardia arthritidis]|uniref:Uncharacterized protein n=1 Tax=Nocardia arthritidis TaxID=228602 RepID=A0A6G9YPS3_9NOCA|nr:hypothetical protein [Nocardia arthritidis]QIS15295.1 hypothetical protein F5544_37340 [Nocardia arthritidis]